jgi:hypothetical protein
MSKSNGFPARQPSERGKFLPDFSSLSGNKRPQLPVFGQMEESQSFHLRVSKTRDQVDGG